MKTFFLCLMFGVVLLAVRAFWPAFEVAVALVMLVLIGLDAWLSGLTRQR